MLFRSYKKTLYGKCRAYYITLIRASGCSSFPPFSRHPRRRADQVSLWHELSKPYSKHANYGRYSIQLLQHGDFHTRPSSFARENSKGTRNRCANRKRKFELLDSLSISLRIPTACLGHYNGYQTRSCWEEIPKP